VILKNKERHQKWRMGEEMMEVWSLTTITCDGVVENLPGRRCQGSPWMAAQKPNVDK
jgi:hypothetical protein